MAKSKESNALPGSMRKLPRIPQGAKIQKRALTRRQPPASSKSRIIYVSTGTPFMSAVKHVRKQLDKRSLHGPAPKNASLQSRIDALEREGPDNRSVGDVVVTVMGTGKAVEKTLGVAGWFEQQGDCEVEMRTKTVGTVDDVVVEDGEGDDESRVRKMSCLEVSIKLK